MAQQDYPVLPPLEHLPEAVQQLRNDRERLFCWHYMWSGGEGAKAARAAGYPSTTSAARVAAHRLLQRTDVLNAIRELGMRYLYSLQPKALIRQGKLLDSEDEKVAQRAIDSVLARTGIGERTAVDVNVSGSVQVVDHTQAAVADLKRLLELGVPREKLVEVFGFSGLFKYERLLAGEQAKLIEAVVVEDSK
jgi:hypothetical protein